MVDLETMGTRPGSVICSIGAVAFDPVNGVMGSRFYRVIDQASCEAAGLTKDPATVEWWSRQSEEAREALARDPRPLFNVLIEFASWWRDVGGVELWAHGANFDEVLLSAAHRAVHVPVLWDFWNVRCTRTLYAAAGVKPDRAKGVHHNALTDAENQAEAVCRAYRILGLARRSGPAAILHAIARRIVDGRAEAMTDGR
ncbi:3'-5' exonuclease [Phenylobacterium sp.]|uniref:3'-5' exonuclease n=1 Tax=Phenylobacterium sp. TaxID=1871053 RepID=UPI00394B1FC4